MVLSESELSQRAAEESLPLRDAFAVLFFVSVGMLFDPGTILREPLALLLTLLIILVGKSLAAFGIVRLFGHPNATALTISASLAQIGEFSFILADLGIGIGLLPTHARDLILGAAILSILANPILFAVLERVRAWLERHEAGAEAPAELRHAAEEELRPTSLHDHAVLVGYGRVGQVVSDGLKEAGWPFLVIEDGAEATKRLRAAGIEMIAGNAADNRVADAANLAAARLLLVAIPNAFEACQIIKHARAVNPKLEIIARAHFDAEIDQLVAFGADRVVMGEREIAHAMLDHAQIIPAARGATTERTPGSSPGVT
jgi:CPA2 family monovalent cation:H+ antiporter-2